MIRIVKYPDLSDGSVLNEAHIFKFIGVDVAGSSSGDTDTEIATVQVPANAAGNGILILAEIELEVSSSAATGNTGTFELRVGTDATVVNNASLRQKVIATLDGEAGAGNAPRGHILGSAYLQYDTTLTKTSLNYVAITAKTAGAVAQGTVHCRQLLVFAF